MKKAVQQIMIGSVVKNETTAREALRHTRAAGMPTGNGGKLSWAQLVKESGLEVAALYAARYCRLPCF